MRSRAGTDVVEISVVLPFRNAAATLPECLDSIAAQTFGPFEVLAIDDGSTDASAELVRKFAAVDGRFRLIQLGRLGLVGALNLGVEMAASPLIARMDADDIMLPTRLAAQAAYLAEHPDVDLVATQVELFPPEEIAAGYREYVRWQNACLTPDQIAGNIYVESPLAHPAVMMRKAVLQRLGGYRDGDFPEDYELWLRMHAAGCRMGKVPQVLLRWRESAARTSRVDPRYDRAAFDRLRAGYLARDPRLLAAQSAGRPIIIWGAGRKTRQRVQRLFDQGVQAAAWIDINPRKIGKVIAGLPVHPPQWLASSAVERERPFVLSYVTNHGARDLIEDQLRSWGYRLGEDYLAVG